MTRHFTDADLKSIARQFLRGLGFPTVEHKRAMANRLIELIEQRQASRANRRSRLRLIKGGKG